MNIVMVDHEYHYFKLIMNIVMVELSRHSLSLSHEHKVSLEKVEGLGLG